MTKATKHSILFGSLKAEIDSGRYAGPLSFPSEMAIARRFGVSRITVQRALRDLERAGMIRKFPRKGATVISERERSRTIPMLFPAEIGEGDARAILRAAEEAACVRGYSVLRINRGNRNYRCGEKTH